MTVSVFPKGTNFTRLVIAKAVGRGDPHDAAGYAAGRWGHESPAARVMKAVVSGGATTDGSWASPLVPDYGSAAIEFFALVRQQTIIGRLAGLRRLPPRVPALLQTSGVIGSWVKEGRAIPVGKMSFERTTMQTLKVAAMTVVSEELLISSDPEAEQIIRADLIRALVDASDGAFISPANAGVEDQSPASITNAVTAIDAGAGTADAIRAGITRLVGAFTGDLATAYFVGSPELFVQMNTVAPDNYPNVGARGGEIVGIPALASRSVPLDGDDNFQLALIDPAGIAYTADDAQADIRVSRQGTIEMDDNPVGNSVTPAEAVHVSMFQVNAAAIAALMHENWRTVRPGSVGLLNGITPTETI